MEKHYFYEEIMDRPSRRRIIEDFLESMLFKSHKEMVKLTRVAIKKHKKDEALLIFFNWFIDEIKRDKNMRVVVRDDSSTYPES